MPQNNYFSIKLLRGEKMNNKILVVGILFVLLAAGTAMAFRGNFGTGTEFDSETRQQMQTAIENNDFQAWKQLQENNLTEENFNAIKERMQERNQNRKEMQLMQEEIQTAIENNDFTAWKALMKENNNPRNTEMLSVINENNFFLFSEMHSAIQSQDFETAQSIREQLGIENGFKKSKFKGMHGIEKGMRKGNCPFAETATE